MTSVPGTLTARTNAGRGRGHSDRAFYFLLLASVLIGIASLAALLIDVFAAGVPRLSIEFLTSLPSRFAERAGAKPAIFGTLWIIGVTIAFSVPVGIGAAIYLEEFARRGRFAAIIEVTISNLAGVPSIIYGLLGLALFVRMFAMGRSVLAGGLTLGLLVLPVVVLSGREALRAVPPSVREAALAVGATPWQTVWRQVLPPALPGIMTGVILAISRAVGETAPLITMGALTYVTFVPNSLLDRFTALPIQIYNWTSRPQEAFQATAAAGIVVLLAILLTMNLAAILIRNRFERRS